MKLNARLWFVPTTLMLLSLAIGAFVLAVYGPLAEVFADVKSAGGIPVGVRPLSFLPGQPLLSLAFLATIVAATSGLSTLATRARPNNFGGAVMPIGISSWQYSEGQIWFIALMIAAGLAGHLLSALARAKWLTAKEASRARR